MDSLAVVVQGEGLPGKCERADLSMQPLVVPLEEVQGVRPVVICEGTVGSQESSTLDRFKVQLATNEAFPKSLRSALRRRVTEVANAVLHDWLHEVEPKQEASPEQVASAKEQEPATAMPEQVVIVVQSVPTPMLSDAACDELLDIAKLLLHIANLFNVTSCLDAASRLREIAHDKVK